MKTLDDKKTPYNKNTVHQKIISQQVDIAKAMHTMFKDKVEVPPFLLSIKIYGKSLHKFLQELHVTSCHC